MLLADKFIERARAHPRCKGRTIGAHEFDIFAISEKILHKGNYGAPVTQAIVPAPIPRKADALFGQAVGTYPETLELSKRPASSIGCVTTLSASHDTLCVVLTSIGHSFAPFGMTSSLEVFSHF